VVSLVKHFMLTVRCIILLHFLIIFYFIVHFFFMFSSGISSLCLFVFLSVVIACFLEEYVCVCFQKDMFILACVETFGSSKVFAISEGCLLF